MVKETKELLVDAIVRMYHISRHNRDEVRAVVDRFWPEPEMKIMWDRIKRAESLLLEKEDKIRELEVENEMAKKTME